MKKTILVYLIIANFLILPAYAFIDLNADHNSYTAIQYLQEAGIVEGFADGTVRPDDNINRAEMLKILIEGKGEGMGVTPDETTYRNCFSDVGEKWYEKYVCYGKYKGWVNGYADNSFRPENPVLKNESVKMILEVLDIDSAETSEINHDYMTPGDWWYYYYQTAIVKNFIHHSEKTSYLENPKSPATRGNVFINLYRAIWVKEHNAQWFDDDVTEKAPKEVETNSLTQIGGLSVDTIDNNLIFNWDFYPDITVFDKYAVYFKKGTPFTEADFAISIEPIEVLKSQNFYLFEDLETNENYYFAVSIMKNSSDGSKSYNKRSDIFSYYLK